MAQKNATPAREQQAAIKRAGFDPAEWVVKHDLNHTLIIRNRSTGTVRVVNK